MPPRRWILGRRITVGYCVAGAAILVAAAATSVQMVAMRDAVDRVHRTQIVQHEIDRVELALLNAQTGQRGYLLTGEPSYLDPYERGRTALRETIAELQRQSTGDTNRTAQLTALQGLTERKLAELKATIDLRQAGRTDDAVAMVRRNVGSELMDHIRVLLSAMQRDEDERLELEIGQRNARFRWAGPASMFSSLLAVFVVGLSTLLANRDARRRTALEHAWREAEERLRVTMRSIGDAVIATDVDGRVTFINNVAMQLTGCSTADARGQSLTEVFRIINEDTRAVVESPVARVLREGVVVGLANHTLLVARDGREIPIDDSGAPIRDADGAIIGVVLVFRDVSERRLQETQREQLRHQEQARLEAEHSSAIKDEFLAILSHELRSPLQGVLGWLTVLRQTGTDPMQQRALQAIERGVRQQAQLVNDILDVSRVTTGKLRIERERVDIALVVDECVDEALPVARERALALHNSGGDCGTVLGDHRRLRQCVTNMLSNAIKFTPSGGRIDVRGAREGDSVVLTVSDTGEGIAPDLLPHVFERFRQAEQRSRYSTSGLGLGLYLVKQMVALHGGTVEAESGGVGCGATFTVRLPVASDSVPVPASPVARGPRTPTLQGLTVLVVDDDADTRESLTTLLSLRGADVDQAESAAAALAAYARRTPDIVVSDISMPGQDGYALISTLRASSGTGRRPPAIALTGLAGPDDRDRATAAGFDAHVAKPIDLDALIQTILSLATADPPRVDG